MTAPVNFYADFQGLSSLKRAAGQEDPIAVREAARQFESVFTKMMLKSMRDASIGDSLMDSDQTKFYQDMFDNQLAMQLSRGKGMGLAELLVKQLSEAGKLPAGDTADTVTLAPPVQFGNQSKMQGKVNAAPNSDAANSAKSVTKGGAEGGHKDVQGVTPSVPNSSTNTPPASRSKPLAQGVSHATQIKTINGAHGSRHAIAQSPSEFISAMWPHAQKAAQELGVDAKTLIAHAALETGWGKHVPCNADGSPSFNLFGIKASKSWNGERVGVNTLEYEAGVAVRRNEQFRSYDSAEESFRDYARMLKNSARYVNAVGSGQDTVKFATALQKGGYATDPSYADKLAATARGVGMRVRQALSNGLLNAQLFSDNNLKNSPVQPLASSSSVSSALVSNDGVKARPTSKA
jgi:peptidoglycan hydrolase FlgJ